MTKDLSFLSLPLPSDIRMLYEAGQFQEMNRLIERTLQNPSIPDVLRRRLLYTKIMAEDVREYYALTPEAALRKARVKVPDLTEAEFAELTDDRTLDWHLIEGTRYYRNNCVSNLMTTRPEFARREPSQESIRDRDEEIRDLDEVIRRIEENGQVTVRSELEESITFNSSRLTEGETLRVWLPLPVMEEPMISGRLVSTSHAPLYTAPIGTRQRTMLFEVPYTSGLKVSAVLHWDNQIVLKALDPDKVLPDLPESEVLPEDLAELPPHVTFTPALRQLAAEIAGNETNPLLLARRVYDFITMRGTYRYMPSYRSIPDIPGYFCSNMRGDCGVQALTFITLCRILGIPARWQSGLWTSPHSSGMHDWARFYVAPYGWLFADCSFGGSAYRAGSAKRHNFYFGHIDPWRIPFASAFQQTFDPPMTFERMDPYDNQCGEAETLHRRLYSDELDHSRTLLSSSFIDKLTK